jgi:hypothetical protein
MYIDDHGLQFIKSIPDIPLCAQQTASKLYDFAVCNNRSINIRIVLYENNTAIIIKIIWGCNETYILKISVLRLTSFYLNISLHFISDTNIGSMQLLWNLRDLQCFAFSKKIQVD